MAREKTVQDRIRGAADALRSEDALRKAARHEDQTAGPWGFEKVQTDYDEGATGGESKTRRAFQAPGPVGGRVGAVDSGGGGEGVTEGVDGGNCSGGSRGGPVLRQGMAGVRDGMGLFEISDGDRRVHSRNKKGKIDDMDDSEAELFQPLQHAAHEER